MLYSILGYNLLSADKDTVIKQANGISNIDGIWGNIENMKDTSEILVEAITPNQPSDHICVKIESQTIANLVEMRRAMGPPATINARRQTLAMRRSKRQLAISNLQSLKKGTPLNGTSLNTVRGGKSIKRKIRRTKKLKKYRNTKNRIQYRNTKRN